MQLQVDETFASVVTMLDAPVPIQTLKLSTIIVWIMLGWENL
jgi:hypothetical protein